MRVVEVVAPGGLEGEMCPPSWQCSAAGICASLHDAAVKYTKCELTLGWDNNNKHYNEKK